MKLSAFKAIIACILILALLGYVCYRRLLPDCIVCKPFEVAEKISKTSKAGKPVAEDRSLVVNKIKSKARVARQYAVKHKLNANVSFLINMAQPSGQKRFYIYDLQKERILDSGLVAHGSGNQLFAELPAFGNVNGSGLSSLGKYKVGMKYPGRFGTAYRLHGLEVTNSNAFTRAIVLHSFSCVPSKETFPNPICNSLGCPMVSEQFMQTLIAILEKESKPVLLWVFV